MLFPLPGMPFPTWLTPHFLTMAHSNVTSSESRSSCPARHGLVRRSSASPEQTLCHVPAFPAPRRGLARGRLSVGVSYMSKGKKHSAISHSSSQFLSAVTLLPVTSGKRRRPSWLKHVQLRGPTGNAAEVSEDQQESGLGWRGGLGAISAAL